MPSPRTDRLALVFVHLTILACGLSAGGLIATGGERRMPNEDEFGALAQYARMSDPDGWVFARHVEHRYPLSKLIWLTAVQAGGYNFRTPMCVTVGLHTAAAVLLVWAVRGWRGRTSLADAIIPVFLLHWGHAHNLLFGWQVTFALVVFGVAGWVWAAGRLARGGSAWAWAAGGFGTALVLSGGFGLVFTPLLVGWMAYAVWQRRSVGVGVAAALFSLAWMIYSAWIWLTPDESLPPPPPVERTLKGVASFVLHVLHYLSVGTGVDVARTENAGWLAVASWGGAGVLYMTAFGTLAVGWWRGTCRGPFAAAVLLVLVGVVGLGAATAYVRGYGLADRFVTTSAVGLAVCWVAVSGTRGVPWPVVGGVLMAGVALYLANLEYGRREAADTRAVLHDLADDVEAGMPPIFLQGKYGWALPVFMHGSTGLFMRELRDGGIGPFTKVGTDPVYSLRPMIVFNPPATIAVPPAGLPLIVALPDPDPTLRLIGVRVRVRPIDPGCRQKLVLHWKDADTGNWQSAWVYSSWFMDTAELTFPVKGWPTELRLEPLTRIPGLLVDSAEWMVAEN